MKAHALVIPALLSLALAGTSGPALATVVSKSAPAVSRVQTVEAMRLPSSVETTSSFPVLGGASYDSTPSVVGSYIAMVLAISGTPCFDCVKGNTRGTFGSGYPLGYVNTNILYLGVLMEWFDVSDTGQCTVSVALTQGTKTLKSASGSFTPTRGSIYNSLMSVTRSSSWHGAATMTGKVACGATSFTEKNTVYFQ
jgi:hypothetical protein